MISQANRGGASAARAAMHRQVGGDAQWGKGTLADTAEGGVMEAGAREQSAASSTWEEYGRRRRIRWKTLRCVN